MARTASRSFSIDALFLDELTRTGSGGALLLADGFFGPGSTFGSAFPTGLPSTPTDGQGGGWLGSNAFRLCSMGSLELRALDLVMGPAAGGGTPRAPATLTGVNTPRATGGPMGHGARGGDRCAPQLPGMLPPAVKGQDEDNGSGSDSEDDDAAEPAGGYAALARKRRSSTSPFAALEVQLAPAAEEAKPKATPAASLLASLARSAAAIDNGATESPKGGVVAAATGPPPKPSEKARNTSGTGGAATAGVATVTASIATCADERKAAPFRGPSSHHLPPSCSSDVFPSPSNPAVTPSLTPSAAADTVAARDSPARAAGCFVPTPPPAGAHTAYAAPSTQPNAHHPPYGAPPSGIYCPPHPAYPYPHAGFYPPLPYCGQVPPYVAHAYHGRGSMPPPPHHMPYPSHPGAMPPYPGGCCARYGCNCGGSSCSSGHVPRRESSSSSSVAPAQATKDKHAFAQEVTQPYGEYAPADYRNCSEGGSSANAPAPTQASARLHAAAAAAAAAAEATAQRPSPFGVPAAAAVVTSAAAAAADGPGEGDSPGDGSAALRGPASSLPSPPYCSGPPPPYLYPAPSAPPPGYQYPYPYPYGYAYCYPGPGAEPAARLLVDRNTINEAGTGSMGPPPPQPFQGQQPTGWQQQLLQLQTAKSEAAPYGAPPNGAPAPATAAASASPVLRPYHSSSGPIPPVLPPTAVDQHGPRSRFGSSSSLADATKSPGGSPVPRQPQPQDQDMRGAMAALLMSDDEEGADQPPSLMRLQQAEAGGAQWGQAGMHQVQQDTAKAAALGAPNAQALAAAKTPAKARVRRRSVGQGARAAQQLMLPPLGQQLQQQPSSGPRSRAPKRSAAAAALPDGLQGPAGAGPQPRGPLSRSPSHNSAGSGDVSGGARARARGGRVNGGGGAVRNRKRGARSAGDDDDEDYRLSEDAEDEEDDEESMEEGSWGVGGGRGSSGGVAAAAAAAAARKRAASTGSGPASAVAEEDDDKRRSSKFRGVTKHRRSGRWEAHIWVKDMGRQVYLGGYEDEAHAAEAYDVAALKSKGVKVRTNFPLDRYCSLLSSLDSISLEELIMAVRRQSQGFSRGSSTYRGVTAHPSGRWESRIGIPGSKHIYLGLFEAERDAATAYDRSLVRLRGGAAATNFSLSEYAEELAEYHTAQQAVLLRDSRLQSLSRPGPDFEKWIKSGSRAFPHLAAAIAAHACNLAAAGAPMPAAATAAAAMATPSAASGANGDGEGGMSEVEMAVLLCDEMVAAVGAAMGAAAANGRSGPAAQASHLPMGGDMGGGAALPAASPMAAVMAVAAASAAAAATSLAPRAP